MRVENGTQEKDNLHASGEAVRPLPWVVSRLISAIEAPDVTAEDIDKIVACDPALAVNVLHIANSAIYGLVAEVTTIDHAVSIMGLGKLRNLAMTIAAKAMFNDGETAIVERHLLWMHSLGCATVARLLAGYIPGVKPDDAFLIGILHDVGKLLLFDKDPERYKEILASTSVLAQEDFWFKTTHPEVGFRSAVAWRLPGEIQAGIRYHHSPESADQHLKTVALIHIANQLAKNWNIGSEGLVIADEVGGEAKIPIDDDILSCVRDQASEAFHEVVEAMT